MLVQLFLYASNAYFLSDDPYHLAQEGWDGRTDKNHQTIAVTLHLHFVARVNNREIDKAIDVCNYIYYHYAIHY